MAVKKRVGKIKGHPIYRTKKGIDRRSHLSQEKKEVFGYGNATGKSISTDSDHNEKKIGEGPNE